VDAGRFIDSDRLLTVLPATLSRDDGSGNGSGNGAHGGNGSHGGDSAGAGAGGTHAHLK
jgi:hypothetical protein